MWAGQSKHNSNSLNLFPGRLWPLIQSLSEAPYGCGKGQLEHSPWANWCRSALEIHTCPDAVSLGSWEQVDSTRCLTLSKPILVAGLPQYPAQSVWLPNNAKTLECSSRPRHVWDFYIFRTCICWCGTLLPPHTRVWTYYCAVPMSVHPIAHADCKTKGQVLNLPGACNAQLAVQL